MTIYWTSEDCDGQAILTLHLSDGQVILFPYFDHCRPMCGRECARVGVLMDVYVCALVYVCMYVHACVCALA